MIGYTEVIQTMAAMIIFSMILINANNMIHKNTTMQIEGEIEQEIISLGQEIIEEARIRSFDRVVEEMNSLPPSDIPGGFTPASDLGPDTAPDFAHNYDAEGNPDRSLFTDFDDYHGWNETFTTEHGDFDISVEVFYVDDVNFEYTSNPSTFKKIEVTVSSKFLRDSNNTPRNYTLEFIRNYYAD
jgi:hypothetical protein